MELAYLSFVKALRMEAIRAGSARELWKFVTLYVQNTVANGTGFHPIKLLVDILFPQHQGFLQCTSLIVQHHCDLQRPKLPALGGNTKGL